MDEDKCFFSELILDFFKYDLVYSYLDYRYEESALICRCFEDMLSDPYKSEMILSKEIHYSVYCLIACLEEFFETLTKNEQLCFLPLIHSEKNLIGNKMPVYNPILNQTDDINLKAVWDFLKNSKKLLHLTDRRKLEKTFVYIRCPCFYISFECCLFSHLTNTDRMILNAIGEIQDFEFLHYIRNENDYFSFPKKINPSYDYLYLQSLGNQLYFNLKEIKIYIQSSNYFLSRFSWLFIKYPILYETISTLSIWNHDLELFKEFYKKIPLNNSFDMMKKIVEWDAFEIFEYLLSEKLELLKDYQIKENTKCWQVLKKQDQQPTKKIKTA